MAWVDRGACDKALCDWVMKASGIPVPEMAAFASAADDYRQQLVTGTVEHIDSVRAASANDKIKEPEKRGRRFGGFAETRKRLLIAFSKPEAMELPTARERRLAQIEACKADAKARAAAKAKKAKRKRR